MATLTEAAKRFIVQALACYDTPTQVSDAVKEEFGIEVPRNQVGRYDPTKASGHDLPKKWRVLFDDTRERFRREVSEIPIADQAYRLRTLQRVLTKVERQGNVAMVTQILEQAAKETGGIFTNKQRHEMTGANGGPIQTQAQPADLSRLSDEELAILAKLADSDKSGD